MVEKWSDRTPALFAGTLFVSAVLLFWVQLLIAKMILPLLGGSPAVWNTCMVFFQATLLLGYAYSYLLSRWQPPRFQTLLHLGLVVLPLLFLPIALPDWRPPVATNPIPWLLALLALAVGLPFLAVSTTAPLMQQWFAQTGHPDGKDPYFLYVASNWGSLLGLMSYPLLIEPNFSLPQQGQLWAVGYGILGLLLLGCGVCQWRNGNPAEKDQDAAQSLTPAGEPPTAPQIAQWVLLSFLPSSALLGTTTYLTTDLAAVPLVWAVPLAIYLLTFILAFARQPRLPHRFLITLFPLLATALILLFLLRVVQPLWLILPLHLLGLGVLAAIWHQELANRRPDRHYLTAFYFWVALGGGLGGLFNAIAAPLLFSASILEYPLILLVSLMLLLAPALAETQVGGLRLSRTLPLGLSILAGGLLMGWQNTGISQTLLHGAVALLFTLSLRAAFALRPFSGGVCLVLLLLLIQFTTQGRGVVLSSDRSFFGVYRVVHVTQQGEYHSLLHGTTLHGKQSLDPNRRREPLTYFSRTGPVGQLFAALEANPPERVGVLGLGVGTLMAYALPDQQWTFYEIDPLAARLARDSRYFTFLQDAPVPAEVVLGDGRLAIAQTPDHTYDLLVMDAFSSDSIPVHLITQEAIQLYLRKLTTRGLLVVNITNRYLDLQPMLGAVAQRLHLVGLTQQEATVSEEERSLGKTPSHWVILAQTAADVGNLSTDPRWQPLPVPTDVTPWTDQFSNVLQAMRLR